MMLPLLLWKDAKTFKIFIRHDIILFSVTITVSDSFANGSTQYYLSTLRIQEKSVNRASHLCLIAEPISKQEEAKLDFKLELSTSSLNRCLQKCKEAYSLVD